MAECFKSTLEVNGESYTYYPIDQIEGACELPFSLKVVMENILRNCGDEEAAREQGKRVVEAALSGEVGEEVEFCPARVLFQDFTGVPVFVDFAVMREAFANLGGDPAKINPQIPCDLVVDHSVIADAWGEQGCAAANEKIEHARNKERYEFLKWAQSSFENVRIVPPGQGICHQLNIEQFASVCMTKEDADGQRVAYFDTLVGTDSHTPTANGIGVLGWGVGGIEAEAAALGQPITTLVPKVYGVRLQGELQPGVTAMDVALSFAEMLRARGVVGCFVECFGPGVANLSATQRACISNMTPEYGSTCTLFPVDERTLEFLRLTGRSESQIELVEAYAKAQGMWNQHSKRKYSEVILFDLGEVEPSMAGPSRPHERIAVAGGKAAFDALCEKRGLDMGKRVRVATKQGEQEITHGAIAIAAVTSCTTATDPSMMLACGMIARNAAALGLKPKPWVKTILAPGSHATELLLERAGLLDGLRQLGFYTCGFGCMSCIGNSGPVIDSLHEVAGEIELTSVLSGNRNFDGRISPDVSQNYLMAPANVIAYAIAGTVDFDMTKDALGEDAQGNPVYFADIAPDADELAALVAKYVSADLYAAGSEGLYEGDAQWRALGAEKSDMFSWNGASSYVRRPTYFDGMTVKCDQAEALQNERVLALLGDFITTDHISPAGAIALDSPAAKYLQDMGQAPADFNTYGSRRGNHEVMMRGTFANVKLQNQMACGKRGGFTKDVLTGQVTTIFEAAEHYKQEGVGAIVVAGKMYGSGSSRDWAAKGPNLLGVRAVIAESFERIHRSNLIGMGILPLQFEEGQTAAELGICGDEVFSVAPIDFSAGLPEPGIVDVEFKRADGTMGNFKAVVRIDTPTEGQYFANGGILQFVLRDLL